MKAISMRWGVWVFHFAFPPLHPKGQGAWWTSLSEVSRDAHDPPHPCSFPFEISRVVKYGNRLLHLLRGHPPEQVTMLGRQLSILILLRLLPLVQCRHHRLQFLSSNRSTSFGKKNEKKEGHQKNPHHTVGLAHHHHSTNIRVGIHQCKSPIQRRMRH